jgi:hypothetical protein
VERSPQKAFDLCHDVLGLVVAPDDAADEVIRVPRLEQSFVGAINRIATHPPLSGLVEGFDLLRHRPDGRGIGMTLCSQPFDLPSVSVNVLGLALVARVWGASSPLVKRAPHLRHVLIQLMEVDIGEERGAYTPSKVANILLEFSTSIPRTQLRPRYGEGFLGAPLQVSTRRDHPTPSGQGDNGGPSRTAADPITGDSYHI